MQSQRAVVAAVEEEGEADLEKNPDTVAELGFDYQVINLILEAGEQKHPTLIKMRSCEGYF